MKKLKKQATAFLLAFLMIFSCLPSQTISATDTVTDTVTVSGGTDAGTEEADSASAQTEQDLPGTGISLGSAIMGTSDADLNAQITSASAGNAENTEEADSTATGDKASAADNAGTADDVDVTDSTGTGNSAGTADSTDTTSSTETNGNATATDSTESGSDAENTDSTGGGSSTGDTGSTGTGDSANMADSTESDDGSGETGNTDTSDNAGETGNTDISDNTENTNNTDAGDNSGDTGSVGDSTDAGDTDSTEDSNNTGDAGNEENGDSTEDSANTGDTDNTDPSDSTTDADDTEVTDDESQADGEDPEAGEEADLETEKETDEETEEGTDEETEKETDEEVDEETLAEDDFDGTYVLPGEQYYEDGWADEILAEAYAEEALFLVTVSNIRLLGNSGISLASELDGENGEEEITGVNWSFDIYYVNQNDPYYVEKTADFSLKYQMEFHTSETLEAGAVEIKIPYALLKDRDGNPINPSDIAVPHAESTESYVYNASMPFNWTVETDPNGVEYLVFFNYREITAGTNVAWQVLYKNLQVMDIVDMTDWTLQAEISVDVKRNGDTESQTDTPNALTGLVDTYANLASVSKNPLNSTGVSYTPGLYTANQLSNYITWWMVDDESDYLDHMDDYVFVVWDVKIKGNGTQPYNLAVLDTATATKEDGTEVDGTVIGYQAVSKSGYIAAISEPGEAGQDGFITVATNQENSSWGTEFYVVTAYSLADLDVYDAAGILMSNDIQVRLEPVDGVDDPEIQSDSASWSYQDYEWTYYGNIIRVKKWDDETLKAWLKAYQDAVDSETDLDGLSYTSVSECYGYGFTHIID
ncbi:MAG: hypothetical protein LUH19_05530, partial [Lachnospiraceae bacterium]|nr:hypothetical protein [Lachnospiraceae bacterium]